MSDFKIPTAAGVEIVLPSGRFARIGQVTLADIATTIAYDGYMKVLAIACRVTTVDDQPLTAEQLLAMPVSEGNPIVEAVAKQLIDGAASKGVA